VRYLDNAATSPVRPEVLEAMMPFLTRWFGNPSSHHTVGEAAARALTDARSRVARVLGMRAGDVVFTAGGTEANNLAVKGISLGARGKTHMVTTPLEHESILESADYLRRLHGFEVSFADVTSSGLVSAESIERMLRPDTALVSLGYANNEVGTVQDVAAIVAVTRAAGLPLHIDAVQAAGWLPLSMSELGYDAVSLAGHKIGAPKGIGVLGVRGRIPLEPLIHGGGQERGKRSGTENVAGAVGFALALELAEAERAAAAHRVTALRTRFIEQVLASVPSARLTGDPEHRLPGTASFTFEGTSGEAILLELERRGVVSSSGSACAAGSDEPSHVLLGLGVDPALAQTAVRFTFGHSATERLDDVAAAVAASVMSVQSGG
jgi:cysteine desulfurase